MLDFFRRQHSRLKWIWVLLIGVFSVTLVTLYIPGIGESGHSHVFSGELAEVGSETVTAEEFQTAFTTYMNQLGGDLTPEMLTLLQYDRQLVDALVGQRIMIAEATRLGLGVTPAEVREVILSNPNFLENGRFIGLDRYESILLQNNLTIEEYESAIRNQLLTEKLFSFLTAAVSVSDEEVEEEYRYQNERVSLDYVLADPLALEDEIVTTEGEEREYFEKNQALYTVPEKRSARFVLFDTDEFRSGVEVSLEEVQRYYRENRTDYEQQAWVRAQHILFRTDDKSPEEVEEVRSLASEVLGRAKAGEDFSQLAQQYSEDTSAASGGDLGQFGLGQMVPEFETAAFSLGEGAISDLVQTDFGLHIIKVNEKQEGRVEPLEEVQDEIETILRATKAIELAGSTAQAAAVELASGETLEGVAASNGGTVGETELFSRADGIMSLGGATALSDQIFSLAPDGVGTAVSVQEGFVVPVLSRVEQTHPATFEEAREQVQTAVVSEKARELAQDKATELERMLAEDRSLAEAARAVDLEVVRSESIARDGVISGFGSTSDLDSQIFNLDPGVPGTPITVGSRTIAFQVAEHIDVDPEAAEAEFEFLRANMIDRKRSLVFDAYSQQVRERMYENDEIRINTGLMEEIVDSYNHLH